MTAQGLFALLFAPSGQSAGGGMTVFLIQIGALIEDGHSAAGTLAGEIGRAHV